ncbi:MAG: glucosidase, partial [Bacteroidota bacterium]
NNERLFGIENEHPFVKDAFHRAVIENDYAFLKGKTEGTKFSPVFEREVPAGGEITVKLRLCKKAQSKNPLAKAFDTSFETRIKDADEFYGQFLPENADGDMASIQRQAFAGMLWTKQFYYLDIEQWLHGDPGQPTPPENRKYGRNHRWQYLNNADIISMPDKWEYPWYAVWDLAFHCVPLAMIDPNFAKNQLILITREWYMAPNGQIPAYEWAFGDVNPPVHAWAALKVFEMERNQTGKGDIDFLKRIFQKLLINFTWWVNRKDADGNNVFEGGFLGLDNIGVFDRSNMPELGANLEQADATSWMGMYALNMMNIALEISREDSSFEDIATKFFEHFAYIAEAINNFGDQSSCSWDEESGFFYDVLHVPNQPTIPIKVRSLVGLSALFATTVLKKELLDHVPEFKRRLEWFQSYRCSRNKYLVIERYESGHDILISLVSRNRLERLLKTMLDEKEFLAPGGIRALSRWHADNYYSIQINGREYGITYEPAESTTHLFGGNSNWRGPIWMPMNYLLIQSIREYYKHFGEELKVEFPLNSGQQMNLDEIADNLSNRLISIFQKDESGSRPVNGDNEMYAKDPHFQDLVLFYEYFHGDNSRGVGASHQTGWTGVVAELIDYCGWKKPES